MNLQTLAMYVLAIIAVFACGKWYIRDEEIKRMDVNATKLTSRNIELRQANKSLALKVKELEFTEGILAKELSARKVIADAISAIQMPEDKNSVLEKDFPHTVKLTDVCGNEYLARFKSILSYEAFSKASEENSDSRRLYLTDETKKMFNLNNIVSIEFEKE